MDELITVWTTQRLTSMDTEEEIKKLLLEICPTVDEFQNKKEEICKLIFAGFPEKDHQQFTASFQQSAGIGGKRIRMRLLRKQSILFNELQKSLYKIDNEPVSTSMRGIFNEIIENETEIMSHLVPPELMVKMEPVMEQLTDKLNNIHINENVVTEPVLASTADVVVEEVLELPLCPVCLDTLPSAAEEYIRCQNNHGMHTHCRIELASRRMHKCPLCREDIETDGGRNFCQLFQINFTNPTARPRRARLLPRTPAERITQFRERAIYLLNNRRFHVDILSSVVNLLENA
jgi:hypothetical protein